MAVWHEFWQFDSCFVMKEITVEVKMKLNFLHELLSPYHHTCVWVSRPTKLRKFVIFKCEDCNNIMSAMASHQPHDCLLNRLFGHRSKKTSKLRVIGLCAGNSPVTGEFSAQRANNAENVSVCWRHHVLARWIAIYIVLVPQQLGCVHKYRNDMGSLVVGPILLCSMISHTLR